MYKSQWLEKLLSTRSLVLNWQWEKWRDRDFAIQLSLVSPSLSHLPPLRLCCRHLRPPSISRAYLLLELFGRTDDGWPDSNDPLGPKPRHLNHLVGRPGKGRPDDQRIEAEADLAILTEPSMTLTLSRFVNKILLPFSGAFLFPVWFAVVR